MVRLCHTYYRPLLMFLFINIGDTRGTIQVDEHILKLEEISEFASKEYALERSLAQMEKDWEPLQFEVNSSYQHETKIFKNNVCLVTY